MTLKEMFKQSFSDPKELTTERYKAAKFAFIITAFFFFIDFYFVGAGFYADIFSNILGTSYILLLLSLMIYVYFLVKMAFIGNPHKYLYILIFVLLFISFVLLISPLVFNGGLNGILNFTK